MPHRVIYFKLLLFICVFPSPLGAQPHEICVPPVEPSSNYSEELASEFYPVIKASYETYFQEISDYITCLDSQRNIAFASAKTTALQYDVFLKNYTQTE